MFWATAHPDDIEFGCGGTLSSFRDRGFAIRAVILTRGEAGANGQDRVYESARALNYLGVSDLATHDFPDAQLSTRFDDLVRVLEGHLDEWRPDMIFTMSSKDHHQDHRVTFDATMAAARAQPSILTYETPNSPPEFCIAYTLRDLAANPHIGMVIGVDDGSTDRTRAVIGEMALTYPGKILAVHRPNGGKAAAIRTGLGHVTAPYVFLTDADTRIPQDRGLGHMLSLLQRSSRVAAVGGVAGTYLRDAPLIPRVRASVKIASVIFLRCAQEALGGAPFCISGACGLFRTAVLREVGIPTRTNVEDLDLTWTLVARGYGVRQCPRAVVYTREAPTVRDERRRWTRWIRGYARCVRLHRRLLRTRFGLVIIMGMLMGMIRLPAFLGLLVALAIGITPAGVWPLAFSFPALLVFSGLSAYSQGRRWSLLCYAPLSMLVTLMASGIWLTAGLSALLGGGELARDKPGRY